MRLRWKATDPLDSLLDSDCHEPTEINRVSLSVNVSPPILGAVPVTITGYLPAVVGVPVMTLQRIDET